MFFIDTDIETIKQYDPIKFIPYLNNCYDLLQSFFVEKLKGLPFDGKYMVEGDHRDPALISSDIYKDTQYWWLLMLYNDIVTLDELTLGKILLYPYAFRYSELYFDLRSNETTYGLNVED